MPFVDEYKGHAEHPSRLDMDALNVLTAQDTQPKVPELVFTLYPDGQLHVDAMENSRGIVPTNGESKDAGGSACSHGTHGS